MGTFCKCAYRVNFILPSDGIATQNGGEEDRELLDDSGWKFIQDRMDETRRIIESEKRAAELKYKTLVEYHNILIESRKVFKNKKREMKYRRTGCKKKWIHNCADILERTKTMIDDLIQDDDNSMRSLLSDEIQIAKKVREYNLESGRKYVDKTQVNDHVDQRNSVTSASQFTTYSPSNNHEESLYESRMTNNPKETESIEPNYDEFLPRHENGEDELVNNRYGSSSSNDTSKYKFQHLRAGANWSLKLIEILECKWDFNYPRFRVKFQNDPYVRNVQASKLVEHGYFQELLQFILSLKSKRTAKDVKKFKKYSDKVGAFNVMCQPNITSKQALERLKIVERRERIIFSESRRKYRKKVKH